MYYRKKIFLSLIEAFGGNLENLKFEKLLFLFCKEENKNYYDFIPYNFGCFSFVSYQDKRILIKQNILEDTENQFTLKSGSSQINELKFNDKQNLFKFTSKYRKYKQDDLIRYVYTKYPFYAKKSKILNKYFTESEILKIKNKKNTQHSIVFTLGYEGKTIDEYIRLLIEYNIYAVIDVRKNPLSMKFDFSKTKFAAYLRKLDIEYFHLPELGIPSDYRKNLNSEEDYHNLFKYYKNYILPTNEHMISQIDIIRRKFKRIALTCFEKNPYYCHRKLISDELNHKFQIQIKHI